MATAQQVINLNAKHPDWADEQLAAWIGCSSAYVRATGRRQGLVIPPRITRPWMKLSTAVERYHALMASLTPRQRTDMCEFAKSRIKDADLNWSELIEE